MLFDGNGNWKWSFRAMLVVFVAAFFASLPGLGSFGDTVLCVSSDGHMAIESASADCCSPGADSLSPVDGCVDIPLAFDSFVQESNSKISVSVEKFINFYQDFSYPVVEFEKVYYLLFSFPPIENYSYNFILEVLKSIVIIS